MTTGWLCPSCHKAHAPSVLTCPEPASNGHTGGHTINFPLTGEYMAGWHPSIRCACGHPMEQCRDNGGRCQPAGGVTWLR